MTYLFGRRWQLRSVVWRTMAICSPLGFQLCPGFCYTAIIWMVSSFVQLQVLSSSLAANLKLKTLWRDCSLIVMCRKRVSQASYGSTCARCGSLSWQEKGYSWVESKPIFGGLYHGMFNPLAYWRRTGLPLYFCFSGFLYYVHNAVVEFKMFWILEFWVVGLGLHGRLGKLLA